MHAFSFLHKQVNIHTHTHTSISIFFDLMKIEIAIKFYHKVAIETVNAIMKKYISFTF